MRDYAIDNCPCSLVYVLNSFKTQKMFENAVMEDPYTIKFVPDCYKTEKYMEKHNMMNILFRLNLFLIVIKL